MPGSLAACSPLLHLHTIGRAVKASVHLQPAGNGHWIRLFDRKLHCQGRRWNGDIWVWVSMSEYEYEIWCYDFQIRIIFVCFRVSNFMEFGPRPEVYGHSFTGPRLQIQRVSRRILYSKQPTFVGRSWTNQPNEPADIHWQNNHHLEVQSRVNGSEGHLVVAASGTMSNMHKNNVKELTFLYGIIINTRFIIMYHLS